MQGVATYSAALIEPNLAVCRARLDKLLRFCQAFDPSSSVVRRGVPRRLTAQVELDDVFGGRQLQGQPAGDQEAVGIVRVTDADVRIFPCTRRSSMAGPAETQVRIRLGGGGSRIRLSAFINLASPGTSTWSEKVRLSNLSVVLRTAGIGAWFALGVALLGRDSQAQFYLGGEAGWTGLFDQTDMINGVTSAIARFTGGFNTGVRAGYQWGPWRFEEEYSYRHNGASDLVLSGIEVKAVGGDRHSNSIMTNVVYDFSLGYPITPHLGFGVGAVDVFDGLKLPEIGQLFNNSGWQFGYQGIAGIQYNFSSALALDLDYRYFATIAPTFGIPRTNLHYDAYYKTNNFVASLIWRFVPPPPPMPVTPSAARSVAPVP